jgi:hypothetical protein
VTRPVVAEVVGRHIVYVSPHFHLIPVMVLYLAATCVSCFFSSHGYVKLFGVLALLSFIAAYLVHVMALVSIWCFFAAILSLLIYLHLRFRTLRGFPKEPVLPRGDRARHRNTGQDFVRDNSCSRWSAFIMAFLSTLKTAQSVIAAAVSMRIGTTRSRVSFFMNRFRTLGFIHYNGGLQVHSSLLSVVLHDEASQPSKTLDI